MGITRRKYLAGLGAATCCALPGFKAQVESPRGVICSLRGASRFIRVSNMREAAPEARRVITLITDDVGIRQNFEVMAADFKTKNLAYATIHNGRRRVVSVPRSKRSCFLMS